MSAYPGHEDKGSEEHAPADDDGRAVFQDEADRRNRVKRAGKGGKEAPEERLGRKRQRRQVAGCRDEDRTDDGENGTEDFLPPRKPFSRMQYHMMMRTGMMYSRTVAAAALLTLMQAK